MATKATVIPINDDAVRVTWTLAAGEAGDAYAGFSEYSDRSVQYGGSFFGATITMKGSNDGSTFDTLNDPFGVALTATAAKLRAILEYCDRIQPVVSGGDSGGTTSVTITIVAKRQRR